MKKRKYAKKEVLVCAIIHSLLALFWIYDAIGYARVYFEIREQVGGMPSLGLKVAAAIVWLVAAIVWTERYINYEKHSKEIDQQIEE